MLALPAPSRRRGDVAISIRGRAAPEAIVDVVRGFGCPEPVALRVIACLEASGRYDCRIKPCAIDNGLVEYAARCGLIVRFPEKALDRSR